MRLFSLLVIASIHLFFFACSSGAPSPGPGADCVIESVFTDLRGDSCKQEIDRTDPNETPYRKCSGVGGYSLVVRRVDAGRRSIDVVDPAQQLHPLNFQEVITRSMFSLEGQAEWRVSKKDGKEIPIALAVRIAARESDDDPAKVTNTYLAIAKIAADAACVTDRIVADELGEDRVHVLMDTAQQRPCAPVQALMTEGGAVIR